MEKSEQSAGEISRTLLDIAAGLGIVVTDGITESELTAQINEAWEAKLKRGNDGEEAGN